jgi:glycosyltransferase involved in cell wall biosynthesis
MKRASVLYIAPVLPACQGNGLAMRAGMILQGLARRFDVHLFVVPVAGRGGESSEFVRQHTARVGELELSRFLDPHFGLIARVINPEERFQAELAYPKPQLSRFCSSEGVRRVVEWVGTERIDAVHVMRLYLAPLAERYLRMSSSTRPMCVLDLDDDEVRSRERLSRLAAASGEVNVAALEAAEAQKYSIAAKRYLAAFDRVAVCSADDVTRLGAQFPEATFVEVPNGCALPSALSVRPPPQDETLRLLLVGTFGCYANRDAAFFLCRDILPALRRLTDEQIQINLVGSGGSEALSELALNPIIKVHDYVEDLGAVYSQADAALVPLRAGGGTRIKILEAFAHGVPVVSTRIGAEGISVTDGQHLLLADDAEGFAQACLRVKESREFACGLVMRASALLHEKYVPARIVDSVSALYEGIGTEKEPVMFDSQKYCPKTSQDLQINAVDDGYIVYQSDRDRVHYLNQTAALILELCNGHNQAAALPELLQSAFDLPDAPVEEVEECLNTLRTEGLVA